MQIPPSCRSTGTWRRDMGEGLRLKGRFPGQVLPGTTTESCPHPPHPPLSLGALFLNFPEAPPETLSVSPLSEGLLKKQLRKEAGAPTPPPNLPCPLFPQGPKPVLVFPFSWDLPNLFPFTSNGPCLCSQVGMSSLGAEVAFPRTQQALINTGK